MPKVIEEVTLMEGNDNIRPVMHFVMLQLPHSTAEMLNETSVVPM